MTTDDGGIGEPPQDAQQAAEELPGPEARLFLALADMLTQPGFLLPLVAAQRQYREHYYGMSSAALLEDLFYDTFGNYLAQFRPDANFVRPARGQRGWDYMFEGMAVSHKVGRGPQDIAVLWDATVDLPEPPVWTVDFPIAFLSSGYTPTVGTMDWGDGPRNVKVLSGDPDEVLKANHRLFFVRWPVGEWPTLLWASEPAPPDATVSEFLPFARIWPLVAAALRDGVPANHLEVLRTNAAMPDPPPPPGAELNIEFDHRSGISMFATANLIDVPVGQNNRGVLIEKATVADLMAEAAAAGLFVPLPLWFRGYASNRPPDLYLAQRAEYDALFSTATHAPAPAVAEIVDAADGADGDMVLPLGDES